MDDKKIDILALSIPARLFTTPELPSGNDLVRAINRHATRERLLNASLDLLSDVYESRATQRFSAIGLSRIQSHIADLRAELKPEDSGLREKLKDGGN